MPILYKLYKQCKICPQPLHSFLLPCPIDGPINFVSPFAVSGPRPEVRRSRSWGHLPRCSRGAKTTRGEPGPGAGTRSAGRSPGWSHRTAGPRERWSATGQVMMQQACELRVGQGKPCGLLLPSPLGRFKAQRRAQFANQTVETLPIILGNPLCIANFHGK